MPLSIFERERVAAVALEGTPVGAGERVAGQKPGVGHAAAELHEPLRKPRLRPGAPTHEREANALDSLAPRRPLRDCRVGRRGEVERRLVGDDAARPRAGGDPAAGLELLVGRHDGIPSDAQLLGERPVARESVTGPEPPAPDLGDQPLRDLTVHGCGALRVEEEREFPVCQAHSPESSSSRWPKNSARSEIFAPRSLAGSGTAGGASRGLLPM